MSEPIGSCNLFHPKGIKVSIPLVGLPTAYMRQIDDLLAQGWLSREPGLEVGEERDDVGWVLHGSYTKDGETTPYVLLYSTKDQYTHSFLKVYLNSPADVAAFEFASKMRLDSIPEYIGDNKPERGKNPKIDAMHIKAPPAPFGVVFKANPKYDVAAKEALQAKNPSAIYPVPKRVFVRWAEQMPAGAATAPPQASGSPVDDFAQWKEWIDGKPGAEAINKSLPDITAIKDAQLKERVRLMVNSYCQSRGFTWDATIKGFREPSLQPPPSYL